MADDLATRLVHAAAEAIAEANWTGDRIARAAVVAVLETLAAEHYVLADVRDGHPVYLSLLAERVKETRNG